MSLLVISLAPLFAQSPTWTIQANLEGRRYYADSTFRLPVLNTFRTFATNKDSIGQLIMRGDSAKLYARFPGNTVRSLATEDTVISMVSRQAGNYIQNQNAAAQTANYAITGNGAVAKMTAFNTVTATYTRFYSLATDAIDTTKQLWTFGLIGTPGGGPINSGGVLAFRSYNTSGAVLTSTALTLSRTGNATIASQLTTGGTITSGLAVVAAGVVQAGNGLAVTGSKIESSSVTVTGDYTLLATDLYVYVNNSANCTITLFTPASGNGAGRVANVKKISNNGFTVTVVVANGANIDNSPSDVISAYLVGHTYHDDGTNYWIH